MKQIPIIGVTSLEALSYNIKNEGLIASLIDAKHDNVYFALFEHSHNNYSLVCPPIADSIANVINIIKQHAGNMNLTFVGDGSSFHKELLKPEFPNSSFASDSENNQTSISVGLAAFDKYHSSNYQASYSISPIYLKKSQAEINLEAKKMA